MATIPARLTEVFASYKPRHRMPFTRVMVANSDAFAIDDGRINYQPRHRRDVTSELMEATS